MKYYTEAYRADGSQLLGNLDGQGVIRAKLPRRTLLYKRLLSGYHRPKWPYVHHWKLVREDGLFIETIPNKWCKANEDKP